MKVWAIRSRHGTIAGKSVIYPKHRNDKLSEWPIRACGGCTPGYACEAPWNSIIAVQNALVGAIWPVDCLCAFSVGPACRVGVVGPRESSVLLPSVFMVLKLVRTGAYG